jgi:hypothetical protein
VETTVKVAAIMTAPRFEITYCRNIIQRALDTLNIPLTVSGGVFYGQCMQKMLTTLCDSDCEYAVTVDFDSLFTSQQLLRLLSIIKQEPDVDAIAGVQVRRGKPTMLGTCHGGEMVGEDEKRVTVDDRGLLKAKTAHFGLTVIDLAKLRSVPKPWFYATPNADGEWEGDKTDDDVHFWLQWERVGNSIYLDPGVKLGHMEEMVAIHDHSMQATHIYPKQWEELNGSGN